MSASGTMVDSELEALRRHGFGVAYRMLGSVSEAEDVAQEALLRLTRQEGPIDEPAAWITTVVTRLSINVLKSARARRESYVGPWLPEPLVEDPAPGPASRAELADSLSLALLVLLERLTPVERAAYLLRDVFGYEYAEIAGVIERTEVNSRQLVTRARKHLEANRPRFDADEAARDALLERFLAAAEDGDLEALEELLAHDAVLYADSGGKARAPQEPLFGAALIARFMAAVSQARPDSGAFETRRVRVNGQPGRVLREQVLQSRQVALLGGREEPFQQGVAGGLVGVEARTAGLEMLPRPRHELPRVHLGPLDDAGDLRVLVAEHLAQQISRPLDRGQPLQEHQQRQRQRIRELRARRRTGRRVLEQRLRQPWPDIGLAAGPRRPQDVDREPRHHGRHPRGRLVDRALLARQAQERLLSQVLGLRNAPEHPVRHTEAVLPQGLEIPIAHRRAPPLLGIDGWLVRAHPCLLACDRCLTIP